MQYKITKTFYEIIDDLCFDYGNHDTLNYPERVIDAYNEIMLYCYEEIQSRYDKNNKESFVVLEKIKNLEKRITNDLKEMEKQ